MPYEEPLPPTHIYTKSTEITPSAGLLQLSSKTETQLTLSD
jgi:hypothetical protein